MKIEYMNPKDLIPDSNQPRTEMNQEDLKALSQSIKNGKMIDPIEIDENKVIIRGHRRREAALLAKLDKVPVSKIKGLTPKQRLIRQSIEAEDYPPMDRAWMYVTDIININQSSKEYTIPEVKELSKNDLINLLGQNIGVKKKGTKENIKGGQSALSDLIGVQQTTIGKYVDLVYLDEENQKRLKNKEINITQAREIAKKCKVILKAEQEKPVNPVVKKELENTDLQPKYVEEVLRQKTKEAQQKEIENVKRKQREEELQKKKEKEQKLKQEILNAEEEERKEQGKPPIPNNVRKELEQSEYTVADTKTVIEFEEPDQQEVVTGVLKYEKQELNTVNKQEERVRAKTDDSVKFMQDIAKGTTLPVQQETVYIRSQDQNRVEKVRSTKVTFQNCLTSEFILGIEDEQLRNEAINIVISIDNYISKLKKELGISDDVIDI